MCTAVYIVNRTPGRATGEKTPEEIWSGKMPDLSSMRVFGCRAMVHVPKANRRKLDDKSTECLFLGNSDESKAYRLYNSEKKKIITSRDVIFMEMKQQKNEVKVEKNNDDYFVCVLPTDPVDADLSGEPQIDVGPTAVVTSEAVATAHSSDENKEEEDIGHSHVGAANETIDLEQTFVDAESSILTSDADTSLDSSLIKTPVSLLRRSIRTVSVSSRHVELNDPEFSRHLIVRMLVNGRQPCTMKWPH